MSETEFFVHPKAICDSIRIGRGTRVWAFCNVQKDAVVGADCNICDHCFVENNVVIGDRVTIKNGVSVWEGVVLEDDVFVGPNAVFTNDIYPRSKVYHDEFDRTLVKKGATIGANAVVVAGNTVGRYAMIGAGAVVTHNVPDYSLWVGNPARRIGFVCKCTRRLEFDDRAECACECGERYRLIDGAVTAVER